MNIKFLFMRITSELTNVRYNQKKKLFMLHLIDIITAKI